MAEGIDTQIATTFKTGTAIRNTSNTTEGTCSWLQKKVNNYFLTEIFWDLQINGTKDSSAPIVLFSNIPSSGKEVVALSKGESSFGDGTGTIIISNNELKAQYCGNISGHWYGSTTYLS